MTRDVLVTGSETWNTMKDKYFGIVEENFHFDKNSNKYIDTENFLHTTK